MSFVRNYYYYSNGLQDEKSSLVCSVEYDRDESRLLLPNGDVLRFPIPANEELLNVVVTALRVVFANGAYHGSDRVITRVERALG